MINFYLKNYFADVFNSYFLTIAELLDFLERFYESDKNIFDNIEKIMKRIAAHQEKLKTAYNFPSV